MEESDPTARMRLLCDAWQSPEISALRDQCDSALRRVRFHHSLRRRWQEVRALTNIHEAAYLSRWEGCPVSADELRELTMREEHAALTVNEQFALGVWRSQWHVMSLMPPLNLTPTAAPTAQPAVPSLIAGLHRDITSVLSMSGRVPVHRVAVPTSPARLPRFMSQMSGSLPAVVCAAAVWAEFAGEPLFEPGSRAVGAALARWILTVRGTDPTGVITLSKLSATQPQQAGRALAQWSRGGSAAAQELLTFFLSSLISGVDDAVDLALSVQAGRPRQ